LSHWKKKNLFKLSKNVVAFLKMNLNKNQIQILCKIEPQKKKDLFKLGRKCCSIFSK